MSRYQTCGTWRSGGGILHPLPGSGALFHPSVSNLTYTSILALLPQEINSMVLLEEIVSNVGSMGLASGSLKRKRVER